MGSGTPGPKSHQPLEGNSMATQTETQDTGTKQTMIWLGAMIVGVALVAYFFI